MDTNYQMLLKLLKNFKPQQRGFLTAHEVDLIAKTLCLNQMNVLQLRNLRDFTVLFLSTCKGNEMDLMDKMSGITSVIDDFIINNGGEV